MLNVFADIEYSHIFFEELVLGVIPSAPPPLCFLSVSCLFISRAASRFMIYTPATHLLIIHTCPLL